MLLPSITIASAVCSGLHRQLLNSQGISSVGFVWAILTFGKMRSFLHYVLSWLWSGSFRQNGFGSVRFAETNPRSSSRMTPVQNAQVRHMAAVPVGPVNNRKNAGSRARSARRMQTREKNNRDAKQSDYRN